MWLNDLQWLFSQGFKHKTGYRIRKARAGGRPVPFDGETLEGCIDFSTFIEPTRHLTGELKELAIRYDPSPYSLRALTNPIPLGSTWRSSHPPLTLYSVFKLTSLEIEVASKFVSRGMLEFSSLNLIT